MASEKINKNEQLALALDIANEAGNLLMEGFEKEKTIDRKSSAIDWVTEYDTASEELIVRRLLAANPGHGIMGEEGSRHEGSSGFKWYIDPLDGTNNYAHRFPMFCISMALYFKETPLLGLVYDPLRKETFHAIKGEGAFLDSRSGKRKIQVSDTSELQNSLLATGFPYDRHSSKLNNLNELGNFLHRAQGIRRAGSAALDMSYVASGRLDGYWEFKLYAWDMAAARLIVEEAGGKFTREDGSPIAMIEQMSLLVSNGHLHDQMLEILSKTASLRKSTAD